MADVNTRAQTNTAPSWRFHPQRDRLLAEAHARPSTPITAPAWATRIAALSGETGVDADRAHMAELCRALGAAEPGPTARWCVVDAGTWRLRWERHTEFSTWTFLRPAPADTAALFQATAVDLAPRQWVSALPGEILAACHVALVNQIPQEAFTGAEQHVGAIVADGAEVQVDGEIDGNVRGGALTIGDTGFVRGDVVSESVTVNGRVEGSIRARKVTLSRTAHVMGDITHQQLSVEMGAVFEGQCRYVQDPLKSDHMGSAPPSAAQLAPPPMAEAPEERLVGGVVVTSAS